ncbi:MAG: thiamine pyrophosphate-dependent dehydrogenase E1 component subunit alpha [Armatimonadota bacterium]
MRESQWLERLLHFYQDMLRIRFFEEIILDEMLPKNLFTGSCHLYIGQEAIAVGVVHALQPDDYVITTHRGHGHCLARGMEPEAMFAEIMGRKTGVCKGKGGSMHLASRELNVLGENPVVGSNIPMAAGAALALKIQGKNSVVACFFGEGAANTGAFHEGLNMAALWDLPVVFLCENNLYAISVPVEVATAHAAALHERAIGYGVQGRHIDGMNVMEVYDFATEAIEEARERGRPSFLVFDTYRFVGHHTSDTEHYRPRDEALQEFRERDPIHFLEMQILDDCILDPDALGEMRLSIRREIQDAFERALQAPWPEPEDALTDVYAKVGDDGSE